MSETTSIAESLSQSTQLHMATAISTLGLSLFVLTILPTHSYWEGDPPGVHRDAFRGPDLRVADLIPIPRHVWGITRSASIAGRILYGLAIFIAFGYFANAGEGFVERRYSLRPFVQLRPLAAMAVVLAAAARSNQLRARSLQAAYASNPALRPHRTITLRHLLGGVTLLALDFAATTYVLQQSGPRFAEHLPREAVGYTVPVDATDVCYARGSRGMPAYEFATDEARFREWVIAHVTTEKSNRDGAKLEEITAPFRITRYIALAHELPGDRDAEIVDGLKFVHRYEDYGRLAAYDRAKKRAYFYLHMH